MTKFSSELGNVIICRLTAILVKADFNYPLTTCKGTIPYAIRMLISFHETTV